MHHFHHLQTMGQKQDHLTFPGCCDLARHLCKRTAQTAALLQMMANMSTTQKMVRQKRRAATSATKNAAAETGTIAPCFAVSAVLTVTSDASLRDTST